MINVNVCCTVFSVVVLSTILANGMANNDDTKNAKKRDEACSIAKELKLYLPGGVERVLGNQNISHSTENKIWLKALATKIVNYEAQCIKYTNRVESKFDQAKNN